MTVPRDGITAGKAQPKFETSGFVGVACKSASEFLAKALGSVVSDEATSEMYAVDQNVERLSENG